MTTNTKTKPIDLPCTLDSANGIKDANGYVFTYPLGDNLEAKEIGEFIIRSVNSHNELLEALKFALEYLNAPPFLALHGDFAAKKAQTAISKAERQS